MTAKTKHVLPPLPEGMVLEGIRAYTEEELKDFAYRAIETVLKEREDPSSAMRAVADRYAHVMAMLLECIILNYNGPFSSEALQTLGAYRDAMNKIHEEESPTHMGEPLIDHARRTQKERT